MDTMHGAFFDEFNSIMAVGQMEKCAVFGVKAMRNLSKWESLQRLAKNPLDFGDEARAVAELAKMKKPSILTRAARGLSEGLGNLTEGGLRTLEFAAGA